MIKIEKLVEGLRAVPDDDFTCEKIYKFLSENPVDVESMSPYYYWSPENYTRNLVYKDDRFEVMVICWEVGVASRIHDHADQMCWMTVPLGRLQGQNFAIDEMDETRGYCRLRETNSFELSNCLAATVELEEPIHQVLNLPEYGERAASIHIYSKPYDHCLSFCRDTDTFKRVELSYTSISGKACS